MLVVGIVVAWWFYDSLFGLLLGPYEHARESLEDRDVESSAVLTGVANPLLLQVKICALAAVVLGSPLWLYQVWAFILPGLHPAERRWTRVFAVVAGPLFIAGVSVGYYVLPKGIEVLVGFTPAGVESLVEFGEYFRFVSRMLLVFGIAFEIALRREDCLDVAARGLRRQGGGGTGIRDDAQRWNPVRAPHLPRHLCAR